MHDTLIYWPIRTLDRTKANPFPLEQRIWYLEWEIVPEQIRQDILGILKPASAANSSAGEASIPGDSETTLTFSGRNMRLEIMWIYRQYFRQRPDFDITTCLQQPGTPLKHIIPVNLIEYFEDEAGNPLSKIDVYKFKTGEDFPIIPFDSESVLRLGPSDLHPDRPPTQEDSNTIAHFLETISYVTHSRWYHSPPALTVRARNNETQIDSAFPDAFETQEVLLALRQLYASDKLFNKAVKSYMRICGNAKKVTWMQQIKTEFDKYLNGTGTFVNAPGITVRELLDTFLYGSRIAHSLEREHQAKLESLIAAHGRSQIVMAVHASFRQLLNHAICVFPVIKQDYNHWLASGKCPKHSGLPIQELLSSAKGEMSKPANRSSFK